MTKAKFEVIIDINDRKPVDEQLIDCYIEDDEDEQLFEAIEGKKFSELTKEQQERVATWKFQDDVEDGFAGEDYDFTFIGIVEVAKKKPVSKKVKTNDSNSG